MYTNDGQVIIGSDDPILASRYRQAANMHLSESSKLRTGTIVQMFNRLGKNEQDTLLRRQQKLEKLQEESKKLWLRLVNSRIHQPTLDALKDFNENQMKHIQQQFSVIQNQFGKVSRLKNLPITQNLISLENKIQEKLLSSKLQGTITSQDLQERNQQHSIFQKISQTTQQQLPNVSGNQLLMSVRARNTQKISPYKNEMLNQFRMKSMNAMLPQTGLTNGNRGMQGRSFSMIKK
ncbi:hypothetical protein SS50377_25370 [Spironucleus salmonicida]|uniref:Uncharacterized protein n=1 Tax=Spironucleus salmonicida TaxID=348837 RepID=V6LM21_9EUKA|nr:hypothetical protein SS50377_25370 [Spironucleus salmonicida]|eukprot:EST41754.1 Hypothetical protein SS50377_18587 [Spironucleus salmonicida]